MLQNTNTPETINSVAEARRALGVIYEPGALFEARIFYPSNRKYSAFVDDPEELAAFVRELEADEAKTYITLNPLDPEMFRDFERNKLLNHSRPGVRGASNGSILRRRWLPFDFDPERPPGTSSTDAEKRAAFEVAMWVREYLASVGFPEPIVADSGNGAHLLYRIDLPPADGDLVRRVLQGVADRDASHTGVNIDRSVHNAARIWKLYGSSARKGENTHERPHRQSRILEVPAVLNPVRTEILERVAAPKTKERSGVSMRYPSGMRSTRIFPQKKFDLPGWLLRYGVPIKGTVTRTMAGQNVTCHLFARCPLGEHDGDQGAVWQFESGAIVARCFHDTCAGYHDVTGTGTMNSWRSVRAIYERRGIFYGHIN